MAYDPNNPRAHYNLDIRVPESIIQEIRELGMEGAIRKARSGTASREFMEGVSRFYPNQWTDQDADLQLEQGPLNGNESTGASSSPVESQANSSGPRGPQGMQGPGLEGTTTPGYSPANYETLMRRLGNPESPGSPNPANAIESTPLTGSRPRPTGTVPSTTRSSPAPRTAGSVPGAGPLMDSGEEGLLQSLLKAINQRGGGVPTPYAGGPR